jgi:hypothetical protein
MRPIEKRSLGSLASLLLPRPVFPCSATQPLPEPNQSSGHRPPLRFATSLGHQSKSTSPEALRRQGARLPPVFVHFPPPECHRNKKFVRRRPKPSITDRPFRWPQETFRSKQPGLPRGRRHPSLCARFCIHPNPVPSHVVQHALPPVASVVSPENSQTATPSRVPARRLCPATRKAPHVKAKRCSQEDHDVEPHARRPSLSASRTPERCLVAKPVSVAFTPSAEYQ